LKVNRKKRQVDLSIKALLPPPLPPAPEVKEEVVEVVQEAPPAVEEPAEDEPAPTAMALAFSAFQDNQADQVKSKAVSKGKEKHRREMDAIVSRTLASRD